MRKMKSRLAVLSVVAGMCFVTPGAFAQTRVNADGHASDANNQVGSGGLNNTTGQPGSALSFQNNIATNNVTRGAGFRGAFHNGVNLGVGYTDPFAFRGLLAGEGVDQFIANSTGVPTMGNPSASSQTFSQGPQPFYGGAATVAPPPEGFSQLPNAPGYTPTQTPAPNPNDIRLGNIDFNNPNPALPKPGEYIVPGPVDPNAPTAPTFFAYSPLYGVRSWDVNSTSNIFSQQTPLQQSAGQSLTQTPTQQRLVALRQELANPTGSAANEQNSLPNSNASAVTPVVGTAGTPAIANPPEAPVANNPQVASSGIGDQSAVGWGSQSNRQILASLPLPAPEVQSSQYAELSRRYKQIQAQNPKTDEEANRQFRQLMQLRQQAQEAATAAPNVDFAPGTRHPSLHAVITTRESAVPVAPSFPAPAGGAPMKIESYAAGMSARGLSDLIHSGEDLTRQQQYDKAISVYDQAIDVAPNNPLILIGRADAELGGGYYRQASVDLHAAFSEDPAVLLSQYDLQKHFGAARVRALASDLKNIAEGSPGEPTHAFLLAYVLYNTHHEEEAAQWVDIADQRSGGQDNVLTLIKKYWNFAPSGPTVIRPAPTTQPVGP